VTNPRRPRFEHRYGAVWIRPGLDLVAIEGFLRVIPAEIFGEPGDVWLRIIVHFERNAPWLVVDRPVADIATGENVFDEEKHGLFAYTTAVRHDLAVSLAQAWMRAAGMSLVEGYDRGLWEVTSRPLLNAARAVQRRLEEVAKGRPPPESRHKWWVFG